uniref:Uncharacterized protein n=1 Tax=Mycena chlorophos TaxID=658473 RepID=A0ABQ0M1I4_MYCCL|nr:predicted protein [Mycena chlorophos]
MFTGEVKKVLDCGEETCAWSLYHPLSLYRNGCSIVDSEEGKLLLQATFTRTAVNEHRSFEGRRCLLGRYDPSLLSGHRSTLKTSTSAIVLYRWRILFRRLAPNNMVYIREAQMDSEDEIIGNGPVPRTVPNLALSGEDPLGIPAVRLAKTRASRIQEEARVPVQHSEFMRHIPSFGHELRPPGHCPRSADCLLAEVGDREMQPGQPSPVSSLGTKPHCKPPLLIFVRSTRPHPFRNTKKADAPNNPSDFPYHCRRALLSKAGSGMALVVPSRTVLRPSGTWELHTEAAPRDSNDHSALRSFADELVHLWLEILYFEPWIDRRDIVVHSVLWACRNRVAAYSSSQAIWSICGRCFLVGGACIATTLRGFSSTRTLQTKNYAAFLFLGRQKKTCVCKHDVLLVCIGLCGRHRGLCWCVRASAVAPTRRRHTRTAYLRVPSFVLVTMLCAGPTALSSLAATQLCAGDRGSLVALPTCSASVFCLLPSTMTPPSNRPNEPGNPTTKPELMQGTLPLAPDQEEDVQLAVTPPSSGTVAPVEGNSTSVLAAVPSPAMSNANNVQGLPANIDIRHRVMVNGSVANDGAAMELNIETDGGDFSYEPMQALLARAAGYTLHFAPAMNMSIVDHAAASFAAQIVGRAGIPPMPTPVVNTPIPGCQCSTSSS